MAAHRALLVLLLAVPGLAPARAHALDVGLQTPSCAPARQAACPAPELHARAAPGERNDVRVSTFGASSVVADPAAIVRAGPGCAAVSDHEVVCDHPLLGSELGDEDDAFSGPGGVVDGGPGDDRLRGSDRPDVLRGGSGVDVLSGGAGDDTFVPDDERVPQGPDIMDGGDGRDGVTYGGAAPVEIDLALGIAGAGGEDRLVRVENASGGTGRDVLRGDSGRNELVISGRDVVDARAGDDLVMGTALRGATVRVGSGRDTIELDGTGSATARCGTGVDRVNRPSPKTHVDPDCEVAAPPGVDPVRLRLPLRALTAPVLALRTTRCAGDAPRCASQVTLTAGDDAVLADVRLARERDDEGGDALVHLTPGGRRLLARRRVVRVSVRVGEPDGARAARFETTLRAP